MSLLTALRTAFTFGRGVTRGLPDVDAGDDPIAMFRAWFDVARKSGILLPEAMSLSTVGPEGRPSSRMVLLKGVDEQGFVFYTNYESRKSHELNDNPHAALLFHWAVLQRQVRIEGTATRVTTAESETYFHTRARGSQIGAWASKQSHELPDRHTLEARVRDLEEQYAGRDVPLPPFWGGYRLVPQLIEFWQGRANRLHDRLAYERGANGWEVRRLYP